MTKKKTDFLSDRLIGNQSESLRTKILRNIAEMVRPRPEEVDPFTATAERSLYEFVKQAWHVLEPDNPFTDGWHIGCICAHLEAVTALEIRKLVINVPPRHAKSLLAAVFWFCWVWVRDPASRWIFMSYAAHLSQRDSDKCRDVIRSNWFQARWAHTFRIKVAQDTKAKFSNDRTGYRIATSVGGIGLGEGGDYLVADDPHNTREALSKAARDNATRYWDQSIGSRGNNPKTDRRVIIMQRLNEDDLSGHVQAEDRGYEHLCLPAEYEPKRFFFPEIAIPSTPAGTENSKAPRDSITYTSLQKKDPRWRDDLHGSGRSNPGDLLWPARFNEAAIAALKGELGSLGSAGQLQQRPSPSGGTIFKQESFRYFGESSSLSGVRIHLPAAGPDQQPVIYQASELAWFQTCDTALKDTETSAYTVVGTFAVTPRRQLLVWHIWRLRLLVPEQYTALMHMRSGLGQFDPVSRKWITSGASHPWPAPLMYQAVEEKASGIGLIQQAAMEGRPFRVLVADVDKVRRAVHLTTMIEAGCVFFRQSARATWLTDFEGELLSFPVGTYKDQVDVAAYAAKMLIQDSLTGASAGSSIASGPDDYRHDDTIDVGGYKIDMIEDNWWDR